MRKNLTAEFVPLTRCEENNAVKRTWVRIIDHDDYHVVEFDLRKKPFYQVLVDLVSFHNWDLFSIISALKNI